MISWLKKFQNWQDLLLLSWQSEGLTNILHFAFIVVDLVTVVWMRFIRFLRNQKSRYLCHTLIQFRVLSIISHRTQVVNHLQLQTRRLALSMGCPSTTRGPPTLVYLQEGVLVALTPGEMKM